MHACWHAHIATHVLKGYKKLYMCTLGLYTLIQYTYRFHRSYNTAIHTAYDETEQLIVFSYLFKEVILQSSHHCCSA